MNRRLHHFLPFLIAGAILSATTPGQVHPQSRKVSTDDLTRTSEIVARGKVREMKPEWDESRSRIRTRVTLAVDEYLKGSGGGTMDVYVPGGEVGSVGEVYSHVAKFSRDEDVILFANRDRRGRFRISGGSQGKFTVTRDEKTGTNIVSNYWTLDDFRGSINRAVRAQGRR